MLNPSQNAKPASPPVMSLNPGTHTPLKNAGQPAALADGKNGGGKGKVEEAQDRFLKLLVTQMKNQDPLNPMDNAQVTSQMAQLSTVSGIEKLNKAVEDMSSSMMSSQSLQAASMIGHVVLVPGNRMELKNDKGAAAVELKQPADNLTVHISDASGNVVRKLDMGSQPAGVAQIQWDGMNDAGSKLPGGDYRISASARLGEEKASATTLSYGLVNGVAQKAEGMQLKVEQLGEVGVNAVKQIL